MKRIVLLFAAPAIIICTALYIYLTGGRYIVTENAYIRSGIAMISAGASGQVMRVLVQENQRVEQGQLLFELDFEPFDIAVTKAAAALDDTRHQVILQQANYHRQTVRLAAAREDHDYALQELNRVIELAEGQTVSQEKLAARRHTLNVANHTIGAAEAEVATALAQLEGNPDQAVDDYPKVRQAKGELSRAKYERRHASVHAGISGTLAKVDLHPGEFVDKGQPLFSLVSDNEIWIEANLKETQLTKLEVGQPASFVIDAYPDVTMTTEVMSIAPASGAEFAILPPQNATGNWVKITQRVPVRLRVKPTAKLPKLRAGMSVEIRIDTGSSRSLQSLMDKLYAF